MNIEGKGGGWKERCTYDDIGSALWFRLDQDNEEALVLVREKNMREELVGVRYCQECGKENIPGNTCCACLRKQIEPKPDYNTWKKSQYGSTRSDTCDCVTVVIDTTTDWVILTKKLPTNPMPEIKPGDTVDIPRGLCQYGVYKVETDGVSCFGQNSLTAFWFSFKEITKIHRPGEGMIWERKA